MAEVQDTVVAEPGTQGIKGRYFALFLLICVYALNFLDRQILSILKEPIAAELHLNDTQTGLMGGLAFALFYSILAIPAAWLADRYSRVWIITAALALWSAFTAVCGLASNFTQIFLSRMGVGVGEAGGVAPAYGLIADYFPRSQRARAIAIYSLGIPIGSAAGVLFGGLIAHSVNWRCAFGVIGLAGVLLAPVFRLLVKEPQRLEKKVVEDALSFLDVAKLAFSKPSFWLLSLGTACASIVGYGLMFWMPTFLARSLHLDIVVRSQFLAALFLVGGIAGMVLGGFLGDRLGTRTKGAYALIPAAAFIISAPLYALGVLTKTPQEAFFLLLIPQALGLTWLGPVMAAVQGLGPRQARSQISALFLLINNLIGLSAGTYFFGAVSDLLKPAYGADSIKWAFIAGLGFYGLAAVFLFLGSRTLDKDWVD